MVRSEEQAKTLSNLGINVLRLDLTDEKAVVRSEEHAKTISNLGILGINVLQLDLTDDKAVVESLLSTPRECESLQQSDPKRAEVADGFLLVSIVVHCSSSIDPGLALHLITALGKQREASGEGILFY